MDPALEPLVATLEGNPDANMRVQAAYDIGQAGVWEGVEYLKKALKRDEVSLVKVAALISLHQLMGENVLEIATECAEQSSDRDVRFAAVEILGKVTSPKAVNVLEKLLSRENDPTVKEMIALSIARKGRKTSKKKLIPLLQDPKSTPRIRERVVEYFINTGEKDGVQLISELRTAPQLVLKLKALVYLAMQKDKKARFEIIELLDEIQSDFVIFVKGRKYRGAEGVKKLFQLD